MAPQVFVITGPTATGKTRLGVELALKANGEVVSADSMQIYKYMDIGTAKPERDELRGVPHHMIDVVPPWEDYSVSRYVEEAANKIDDILARGKLPIIVGGTGLYIDSLLSGRFFADRGESGVREELERMYDETGGERMLEKLAEFDGESAARLHANDKRRILRAFEIFKETGLTVTEHNERTRAVPLRYDAVKLVLNYRSREALYARIDARVDEMLRLGLKTETEAVLRMGAKPENTAMQAIGYKEMAKFLAGECGENEAVDRIKQESRRYAKRQLSWLRRDERAVWLEWEKTPDFDFALHVSTNYL